MAHDCIDEIAVSFLRGLGDDARYKIIEKSIDPAICMHCQEKDKLSNTLYCRPYRRIISMFVKKAVPYVLSLFDSHDSDVRFYATLMFSEFPYPKALGALTMRLFDNDYQIRALAIDVLKGFKEFSGYRWAMREVVKVLKDSKSSLDTRRAAAHALGNLREPSGVSALAETLVSTDEVLVGHCHRALVKITFSDFGLSVERWLSWWGISRERHRIEWAINSVVHLKEQIRNDAIKELKSTIGDIVEWPEGRMNDEQRLDIQKHLREWWSREGVEFCQNSFRSNEMQQNLDELGLQNP
ncbi:MAG: HEAT repeat domain-containing protein [Proteobacteria bacterium]|nr:HEAT repeat domain-containing protein [Pseudomonadota bacterium]